MLFQLRSVIGQGSALATEKVLLTVPRLSAAVEGEKVQPTLDENPEVPPTAR